MSGAAPTKLALNFYYFLLCDEALAIMAATRAMKTFKKISAKLPEANKDILLVKELVRHFNKIKTKMNSSKLGGALTVAKSEWEIPKAVPFSQWKEYIKKSDGLCDDVLVLRYILNFPTNVIAEAMNVPEGTVLFRLGRGLEVLSKR
jgi:hypothetical protein